jgi:Domain of unknown function (DUF1883)/TIR domain
VQFTQYDLGQLKRGSTVVVTLQGSGANLRLMTWSDLNNFKNGRQHHYHGGLATSSPASIPVPSDRHWYLTVDLQGLHGSTRSSVRVEPPPLPPLRPLARYTPPSLSGIRHTPPPAMEVPADNAADGVEHEVAQVWDVFVSHASEDKQTTALPLATALRELKVSVWLDDFELKIGDSLRRKIDHGLAHSRFGVVILSKAFFAKDWPQYELDGLVTRSVSGEQSLLPIWHGITRAEVIAVSPSLADKIARSTTDFTTEEIAKEIAEVVRPTPQSAP